jgi:hypothetical protein
MQVTMKRVAQTFALAGLLWSSAASALTIEAVVDGPLAKRERLLEFVRDRVNGPVARIPDVEQGGKHRLLVRVSTQHTGSQNRFLCLIEFELQRQVVEQDTGFLYWAMIHSTTAWGTVPSEIELMNTIGDQVEKRVNRWAVN